MHNVRFESIRNIYSSILDLLGPKIELISVDFHNIVIPNGKYIIQVWGFAGN